MCNRWVKLIWYELVIINVIKRLAYDEQIFGYLYIRNLVPQFIEDLLKYSNAIFGFEYFNVKSNYFLITSLVILFPLLWFFTHVFKLQTFSRLYIFQKIKLTQSTTEFPKLKRSSNLISLPLWFRDQTSSKKLKTRSSQRCPITKSGRYSLDLVLRLVRGHARSLAIKGRLING